VSKNSKAEVDAALAEDDFEKNSYQLDMNTSMGRVCLDLFYDTAPGHCRNIIGLAKIGFYNGLIFHRVIKDFMVQGGCPDGNGMGGPGYNIDAEFNDRPHEPGVLSMARSSDPNSAGSQFFLCTAQVPHLDNQYTAFGKAADEESLAVIMSIGAVETAGQDRPVENVSIESANVIETAK